mmetsp:Transcript_13350/g.46664  ORF Transcript_13350/g.46664 Transcript_13350/m.46664 type:complete len:313 (-) Transcript_13350:239-1177(-)
MARHGPRCRPSPPSRGGLDLKATATRRWHRGSHPATPHRRCRQRTRHLPRQHHPLAPMRSPSTHCRALGRQQPRRSDRQQVTPPPNAHQGRRPSVPQHPMRWRRRRRRRHRRRPPLWAPPQLSHPNRRRWATTWPMRRRRHRHPRRPRHLRSRRRLQHDRRLASHPPRCARRRWRPPPPAAEKQPPLRRRPPALQRRRWHQQRQPLAIHSPSSQPSRWEPSRRRCQLVHRASRLPPCASASTPRAVLQRAARRPAVVASPRCSLEQCTRAVAFHCRRAACAARTARSPGHSRRWPAGSSHRASTATDPPTHR